MKQSIIFLALLLILISFLVFLRKEISDNKCKRYIIEHKNEIIKYKNTNYYKIIKTNLYYYEDISIKLISDSSYYIIFWGDRNSYLWNFKADKSFGIDIPYNRYKKIDVTKDIQIINILNNIK